MPNVMFKRGPHANLANTTLTDGCFYLTTDTDRLFVATKRTQNSDPVLVEINKSIEIVNSISQLPQSGVQVGQFYYVSGTNLHEEGNNANGNILAVVTAVDNNGHPTWVQVNPDTVDGNDNDYVSGLTIVRNATNAALSNPTELVFDVTITNAGKGTSSATTEAQSTVTSQLTIPISDIISAGASVGLGATYNSTNESVTLGTTGNGANTASTVTLVAGENIDLTRSGTTYTLDATDTTYGLVTNTSNKTVGLIADGTTPAGSIIFAEGSGIDVSVSSANSNADGTVTIAHESITAPTPVNTSATLDDTTGIAVMTGITEDGLGHVTGYTTKTLTIPSATEYSIDAIGVDSTDKSKLSITYTEGVTPHTITSSSKDLFFSYGDDTNAASNPKVYNQGNLSVYTRAEIDGMISTLDGMTYKGVVPAGGLPTTGVKNGDTYKVNRDGLVVPAGNGSATGEDMKIGDILIAHGTEENGVITAATLAWDYIPAGDETDTQYDISAASNIITLAPSDVNSSASSSSVTIAGGNKLTASTSSNTITIDHDAITTTGATSSAPSTTAQTLDYGGSIPAVIGVAADGYGHITNVYTKTFTLPDAPAQLEYAFASAASTGSHGNGVLQLIEDPSGTASVVGEITFQNGNDTTAVVTQNPSSGKINVKVDHNTLTPTYTNHTTSGNEEAIDYTTGADVITAVGFDSYGHVNAYTKTKLILPNEVKLTLNGSITDSTPSGSSNTKATVALNLLDDNVSNNSHNGTGINIPQFSISTSSLKVATTAATASTPANIAIDIEWGSF